GGGGLPLERVMERGAHLTPQRRIRLRTRLRADGPAVALDSRRLRGFPATPPAWPGKMACPPWRVLGWVLDYQHPNQPPREPAPFGRYHAYAPRASPPPAATGPRPRVGAGRPQPALRRRARHRRAGRPARRAVRGGPPPHDGRG